MDGDQTQTLGGSASPLDLSLIVACYNEEPHLEESVRQVLELLDATRWSYELIFVEDCSKDRTREVIDRILKNYPERNHRAIFHTANTGRGRTVSDGFRAARGGIVGFIDIDLEVAPCYILPCVLALRAGADVATGEREYKVHLGLLHRHVLSRGYHWLIRAALGFTLGDTESGYKFFRRDKVLPVLDEVEDQGWFWDTEIMVRCYLKGHALQRIPCLFLRRSDKKSTVRVVHDTCEYFLKLWRFRTTVKRLRGEAGR